MWNTNSESDIMLYYRKVMSDGYVPHRKHREISSHMVVLSKMRKTNYSWYILSLWPYRRDIFIFPIVIFL